MLALPFSQYIATKIEDDPPRVVEPIDHRPPVVEAETPPPDVQEEQPKIEDPQEPPQRPTLDQIEGSMVIDRAALAGGMVFRPYEFMPNIEDDFVELRDLSRPPRALVQTEPIYPPQMLQARISGEIVVEFIVRADGSTRDIRIVSATHPGFEETVRNAVRRWQFEPGEKDGRQVNTRVRQLIPFRHAR